MDVHPPPLCPPPLPPPPQPDFNPFPTPIPNSEPTAPQLTIPATPPTPNARLVSLLIYNGWPFADHWEYFVASPIQHDTGTIITAAGNVRVGFALEIKRQWDLRAEGSQPDRRVALGWVGSRLFEDIAEGGGPGGESPEGGGGYEEGPGPVCAFERALFRCPAPEKTLRNVDGIGVEDRTDGRVRITQRNCQTWVIEAAEQLEKEGIFEQKVVDFLRSTRP
ncbi:hypothetical protein BT67DRAFT_438325 [Trichocladium antarcticum]|uniref:Uncharacterized protein n=1 Tax=Trichocladium antarcticum TaxID=1450529 RepID=A0AAN6ZHV5_9PEZI|nr:hypothetical protein BT67DRAFT_438325 [Trichocladium antarcticum]